VDPRQRTKTVVAVADPGRRQISGHYLAMLSLAGVLGLLLITIGAVTTTARGTLAVIGVFATLPAILVVAVWAVRGPRRGRPEEP
jgi:uncharacterized integral membrane protein